MKKLSSYLVLAVLFLHSYSGRAQTLIGGWDFQTTTNGGTAAAASPSSPRVYVAPFGIGGDTLFMDNTHTSSNWSTATEISGFGGTALNAGTGFATATSGASSLAVVGGTGFSANGKFMVFKFNMTGYVNLVVSYASQKTATGFATQTWEYSTDGVTWVPVDTISPTTGFATYTVRTITGLNNTANALLRMIPKGASNVSGNNRLDNIQLKATPASSTNLTATTLTGFGANCTGTTVGPDSFTITGTALSVANVTVGALAGYTYSTSYAGTYTSTLSLTQPGGSFTQKVYVKFTPTAVVAYNGNISVGGGGATSINVAVTGSGINTLPTATTGAATAVTTSSATTAGSLTAGCSPTTSYGIEYSTTAGFTPGTGTQVAGSNLSGGSFSVALSLLAPGTTYYYRAYNTTAVSTYYGTELNFFTNALVATLGSGPLASFDTVCTGTTSAANSFTITGASLTGVSVNVGPLTGFTFSTTSGGTYTSSLALTATGGAWSQAIYVKFSPTLAQSYSGTIPVNGGGALTPADVAVDATGIAPPAQPSAISGPTNPCKSTAGLVYSVTPVAGTTYTWAFPSGWLVTAGAGTYSVTVTSGTGASGNITVTPNNSFCNGTSRTLAITTVAIPTQPSVITGNISVCTGATGLTYSVTNVTGMTYNWTLPSGWVQTAGGTTNSITVDAGTAGGTISVTAANASCSGTARTLGVSVSAAPSISATSSSPICAGDTLHLIATGTNFDTYQWTDPAAATSGQVYQQNFNNLPVSGSTTWVDNSTIPGWYAASTNLSNIISGTGTSTTGSVYSFGSTGSTDRALGSLASGGSDDITYGLRLVNTTGGTIDRVYVKYTGEQWRDGGPGASANSYVVSYSTTATGLATGTYTTATALAYTTTVATGTAAALNGNANQQVKTATITLATPVAAGGSLWLKWLDADDSGNDMGIALDDLTVIMYNNSNTLLSAPATAAVLSSASYAAAGTMTSSTYAATAVATPGTYTVKVTDPAGCSNTSTTTVVISSPATAVANTTATAGISAASTYTLTGSATNYTSYTWSHNGTGSLTGTGTLSPTYHPGAGEFGPVTITLTVAPLSPCADPAVDSMVLNILPAAGNTWIGNTSNWFTASNWTSGTVPNACGDVANIVALTGGHVYPVLGATSAQVGNFSIAAGAQITINTGRTLSVCGSYTGGTASAATVLGAGAVVLNGTAAQTVSGRNSFTTLTINKTTGATTISGITDIATALVLTRGAVTNSGTLTLKSNASGTAYMDNFSTGNSGTYAGPLTVERYIASSAIGYRELSSPVASTVSDWAADFSVVGQNGVNCYYAYNPYPTLQYYSESTNNISATYYGGYISTTAGGNALAPMRGYAARIYTAPLTINTTGAANNGSLSIAITKSTTSDPTADGWNLIGNPYPSSVSWNAIKALNPGKTDGSVYRFMTSGEYSGNYATWNGSVGTNGATDEIASSQGFWVLTGANNTITVNNTVRVASTAATFYKTTAVQADEVRLTLSNGVESDEIVSYSDADATAGYDAGLDATKMAAGSTVYLSYDMPAREMAINVMDQVTEQTILPLRIAAADSGTYTLTATTLNVNGLNAYLRDAEDNTLTDLSATAPVLTLAGGRYYTGRYSVVFKKKASTTPTGIVAAVAEKVTKVYSYEGEVYVVRPSASHAVISISNVLGQQLAEQATESEKTIIPVGRSEPFYAIVKVIEGNKVTTQKVFISHK